MKIMIMSWMKNLYLLKVHTFSKAVASLDNVEWLLSTFAA